MQALFAIFIGGGLGSLCRYGISRFSLPYFTNFPIPTLSANILASCLLGFVAAYFLGKEMDLSPNWKLFLGTGFCGGLSTFSTFSLESLELIRNGNETMAFAYILVSVVCCLIACFIGYGLAKVV